MFNELEFNIKMSEKYLKTMEKGYKILIILLLSVVSILIFDLFQIHDLSKSSLVCIGILIGNSIFILGDLFLNKENINRESNALNHYKEMQRNETYISMLERLKEAEKNYLSAIEYYRNINVNPVHIEK